MKKLSLALVSLMSVPAFSGMPIFVAKCPMDINVDGDGKIVYINGNKATVKKMNDIYYEAKASGVIISISIDASGAPILSYTGKHGANGMCQVKDFEASKSNHKNNRPSASERAGQGKFDATGNMPCAQHKGQPMGQCSFGVARGSIGSATVSVTLPDGRKRAIFFEKGVAIGADLSQADGSMNFRVKKQADLYIIDAGDEHYEFPEAVVFGG